jgi:DNA repair exonuclease SbcCD ATPase subunit
LERTYYTVNVAEALQELNDVGNLLRIAYAGTHGRRSSQSVIRILSNYQHMVKDTFVVTGAFVISSLTAMSTHRIAMKFVEKGKLDKALEKMQRCAEMAREMATLCEQLKGVANDLVAASSEALDKAVEDSVISREEKEAIKKRMDAAASEKAYRETQKAMLDEELQRALADEQAELSRQERAEQRKFVMDMLKAGASVVSEAVGSASPAGAVSKSVNRIATAGSAANSEQKSSSSDENGSASDRRLDLMRAARYEKEKELRENNAILARQLTELNQLTISGNDLEAAIKALEVAITSLGKIKTIFENTRLFWAGMEVSFSLFSAFNHSSLDLRKIALL